MVAFISFGLFDFIAKRIEGGFSRLERIIRKLRLRKLPLAHQLSNATTFDRYPKVFKTTVELTLKVNPKILSFGCSTGEECMSLRQYFDGAMIVGLDVDTQNIKIARSRYSTVAPEIVFDLSSPITVKKYGPFDIIFCMSVLCRWPETENVNDCSQIYSFDKFEDTLILLDKFLAPNGLMVIHNSNFRFTDSQLSKSYMPIEGSEKLDPEFVHKFGKDNKKILANTLDKVIYKKIF